MTVLGGAQEVGRSAFLIKTRESSVLLDCGIHPGSNRPLSPFHVLTHQNSKLTRLDAVVISHAHLDHCGLRAVPLTNTATTVQSIARRQHPTS
jgi:uncharacterized protein